jgi:hypothetical protein
VHGNSSSEGPDSRRPRLIAPTGGGPGRAQLTLVEHSLCPLDTAFGLREGLIHSSEFFYHDANRHMKRATARVVCPFGLSPVDEFYLWGLIALTLSQPEPSVDFYATPHYCLSELGLLPKGKGKGGKNYALFRQSITRLSTVTYLNDGFYDPVRGERRNVSFGFLSYSLPTDPASSRAWRLAWDPIFFEFCRAASGSLRFDMVLYRSLDFASRRLFLLLKKIFWRNVQSPVFEVRHLGVNVLGFSPSIGTRDLKVKLGRCAERLVASGVVVAPEGGTRDFFEKKGVGSYTMRFRRGAYFDKKPTPASDSSRSPLYEPLKAIGFDDASIARILKKYKPSIVQTWADITLAAKEKKSPSFFKVSPQAYFMDNVEKASRGTRTPPDWWYEHRKEEDRREREERRSVLNLPDRAKSYPAEDEDRAFEKYIKGEGRAAFGEILELMSAEYRAVGQDPREAERNAAYAARTHMRSRFRREHARDVTGPRTLSEILKRFKLPDQGPEI